jgi:DNA-binding MurR/RpiR family transcriptional regulator
MARLPFSGSSKKTSSFPTQGAISRQDKLAHAIVALEADSLLKTSAQKDASILEVVNDAVHWLRQVQSIPLATSVPEASELAEDAQQKLPNILKSVAALSGKHKVEAVKLASTLKAAIE